MFGKYIKNIILLTIFVIFVFFRFYNFENRVVFDWDQERDALVAYDMIVNHKPTLIGPRVVGPEGFFLGPYFSYLIVPFYLIANLNPQISILLFLFTVSLVTFFGMYVILKKIFDKTVAFIFLFLWSINPLLITYETTSWNPILISIGIVWLFYILYKIYQKNETKDWIFLGLNLGLFFHFHFQYIFVIIFAALFILLSKIKLKWKNIIYSKLVFLATFLPLLLFDLRHNFLNSKMFIKFFFGNRVGGNAIGNSWIEVVTNFNQSIVGINSVVVSYIFYVAIFVILIYLIRISKKFENIFFKSVLGMWIIFPIFFTIYSKRPSEYYFMFLYPFIFVIFANFVKKINRTIILIFLLILLNINLNSLRGLLVNNNLGLKQKNMIIARVKELAKDKQAKINFNTDIGRNVGFDYLIKYHKINVSDKEGVPSFEITIPPKDNQETFGGIGLQIPKL